MYPHSDALLFDARRWQRTINQISRLVRQVRQDRHGMAKAESEMDQSWRQHASDNQALVERRYSRTGCVLFAEVPRSN